MYTKHLQAQKKYGLDIDILFSTAIMAPMKTRDKNDFPLYIVQRFHGAPVAFETLAEAEEFAQNCGDFDSIWTPTF